MLLGFLFRIVFRLILIIFAWGERGYGKVHLIYYGEASMKMFGRSAEISGVWVRRDYFKRNDATKINFEIT